MRTRPASPHRSPFADPRLTAWHDALREPLPTPCPARLIPDVTEPTGIFDAAYQHAQAQHAVLVAIESQGQRWTVKADTLTAGPGYVVVDP